MDLEFAAKFENKIGLKKPIVKYFYLFLLLLRQYLEPIKTQYIMQICEGAKSDKYTCNNIELTALRYMKKIRTSLISHVV